MAICFVGTVGVARYTSNMEAAATPRRNWAIFLSSVFFVLGFSVVFAIVGVLLQTALAHVSYQVQTWLGWIGGAIIIIFGLFLLRLFTPKFLERERTIAVRRRFRSQYVTSFVFGAAFAVGWTPCVSAALGAILALAATAPSSAFFLLFAYTLGIGIPFLIVGFFVEQVSAWIARAGKWLLYVQYFFGAILVVIGILVFVGELSRVANLQFAVNFLDRLNFVSSAGGGIKNLSVLNLGVALLAGFGSFLSPCILPIVPGFLSYLAGSAAKTS